MAVVYYFIYNNSIFKVITFKLKGINGFIPRN